ncbi:putative short chain dehydrogenase [Cavenderia fasciculata]|uniref:Short chain dehydrogenase n=1 Tax=Cavenderia fasciculata TaxID=261658 RepID=F4Q7I5_CACFS|nr:putative short chain dehydrogenase [Cavenderia fasciculata]EGG16367.1 putative short chain dehydrogenase [Cavenderia fasciculata]|eukprot:XP_004354751.1 putative short chain dehydrogenase [Cavenderia fasciculata]
MSKNLVAAIIGVGPGIGLSVSRKFAKEGFKVALVSRNKSKLDGYLDDIKKEGGNGITVSMDTSDEKSVEQGFKEISSQLGPIDVLVYNVSGFKYGPLHTLSAQDFENTWKSCCLGGFLTTKQVIPSMIDRKQGTILVTGATASLRGGANFSAFASGKAALRALSQSLARELSPQGIHVAHVIIDGQVDINRDYSTRPKDSFLNPDEIANNYFALYQQDKTTWTQELDLRPFTEKF